MASVEEDTQKSNHFHPLCRYNAVLIGVEGAGTSSIFKSLSYMFGDHVERRGDGEDSYDYISRNLQVPLPSGEQVTCFLSNEPSLVMRFRSPTLNCYKHQHVVIFVYSVNDRMSAYSLKTFIDDAKCYAPQDSLFVFVGNKIDLIPSDQLKVNPSSDPEMLRFLRDHVEITDPRPAPLSFLTSAKTGEGIKEMLTKSLAIRHEMRSTATLTLVSDVGIRLDDSGESLDNPTPPARLRSGQCCANVFRSWEAPLSESEMAALQLQIRSYVGADSDNLTTCKQLCSSVSSSAAVDETPRTSEGASSLNFLGSDINSDDEAVPRWMQLLMQVNESVQSVETGDETIEPCFSDTEEGEESRKALLREMLLLKTCPEYLAVYAAEMMKAEDKFVAERAETSENCRDVMSTKTADCRHCLVILVGEPEAGKTSFRRAAMGEDFCEDSDSTEGIVVTTTAAELTNKMQQECAVFRETAPDGILVQAFSVHMKEVSSSPTLQDLQPQSNHAETPTASHILENEVTSSPTEVALSSEAEVTACAQTLEVGNAQWQLDLKVGSAKWQSEVGSVHTLNVGSAQMQEVACSVGKTIAEPATGRLRLSEASVKRINRAKRCLDGDSKKTFVRFVDCGGHLSFLSTQTVCFSTKNTVYVLAFDASRPLLDVKEETFRQCGRRFSPSGHLHLSHIDYIMHWLSNIAMVSNFTEECRPRNARQISVLLLATHIDKVSNPEETMDAVKSTISERLAGSNLEERLSLVGPYFVDNRKTGCEMSCTASEMKQAIKVLHDEIEKSVEAVNVPLKWLLLDVILDEIQKEFPVLTLTNFFSVPEVAEVVNNSEEDRGKILKYLSNAGRIRLLGDQQAASAFVFSNPEWLVQQISKVMVYSMTEMDYLRDGPRRDVQRLQKEGILTKELYSYIWKDRSPEVRQALLQVMELYGLQSPIYNFDGNMPTEHWVPSCLPSDQSCERFRAVKSEFEIPPMRLTTDSFIMPLYIFPRLVAYLLQLYKPKNPILTFNAVQFVCSSPSPQKSSFYQAKVSHADHGILIGVLCSKKEVAFGALGGVPNIATVAHNFCVNICKRLQCICASGCNQLNFEPEFACPIATPDKQNWVKPNLPVQLPLEEPASDDAVRQMLADEHPCSRCLTAHRLPQNWVAWFGSIVKQESLGDELEIVSSSSASSVHAQPPDHVPCRRPTADVRHRSSTALLQLSEASLAGSTGKGTAGPIEDSGPHPDSSVTDNELLQIMCFVADYLGSFEQCYKLAQELHVDYIEMTKLLNLQAPLYNSTYAAHMLNVWQRQRRSLNEAYITLRSALVAIQRYDIIREWDRRFPSRNSR